LLRKPRLYQSCSAEEEEEEEEREEEEEGGGVEEEEEEEEESQDCTGVVKIKCLPSETLMNAGKLRDHGSKYHL